MRIALFVPSLAPGGAERVILRLAGYLNRQTGVNVDLVVNRRRGLLAAEIPRDVSVYELGAVRTVLCVPRLIRYLRSRRPDALLCTMLGAIGASVVARKLSVTDVRVVARQPNLFGAAYLGEAHAGNPVARVGEYFLPRFLRACDDVVAVSRDVRQQVIETGVDPGNVHYIPNPFDPDAVRELAHEPLDDPWFSEARDVPVVVSAGRLVRQKGYGDLLEAVARLRARRAVRCVVLGDGPLRSELERQRDRLGLQDVVAFPGVVANPYRYFSRADAFVSSSHWEGMPNVILEAFACGCPVVATDCPGGTRDLLRAASAGRLVNVGDPKALAVGLDEVLAKPGMFLGNAESLDAAFGIHSVSRRYLEVLRGT